MTRRKRGKMAKTKPEHSAPEQSTPEGYSHERQRGMTLKEIPEEQLLALAEQFPKVAVSIRRRNNKGQLASLGWAGLVMTPQEVIDLPGWIFPRAGGGSYTVVVVDPAATTQQLVPPFEIVIEGLPRAPVPLSTPALPPTIQAITQAIHNAGRPVGLDQFAPPTVIPAGVQNDPTRAVPGAFSAHDTSPIAGFNDNPRTNMNWASGLHPSVQEAFVASLLRQPTAALPPGATMPSDQLAMEQLRRAESRSAELDAKLTAFMQRAEERERALTEQIREERDRHRDELHKAQLSAMEQRMAMMTSMDAKKPNVTEYAPLVAALAPVLTTMVSSGKEQQTAMMTAQQQATQQFLALIADQAKKPPQDPLAAVEKLMPLFTAKSSSETTNAALFEAMSTAQMNQMGMMAQMVESFAAQTNGGEPPAWLPVVQQIAAGILGMQQAAAADRQRAMMLAAQNAQQRPPMQAQTMPVRAPAAPAQAPASPAPSPEVQVYPTPSAAAPVEAPKPQPATAGNPYGLDVSILDVALPQEFRTPEWKSLIMAMHEHAPADKVGVTLAKYIGHLDEFEMLPGVLAQYHGDPVASLRMLMQPLPVYTGNPAYCEQVAEQTVQQLFALGVLVPAGEDEESEEEEEEEPEAHVPEVLSNGARVGN